MILRLPDEHRLVEVLARAIPSVESLQSMVRAALHRTPEVLALHGTLEEQVRTLVAKATTGSWVVHLIGAARDVNPTDRDLLLIAEQIGLAPSSRRPSGAESLVDPDGLFEAIGPFVARLGRVPGQVCRIIVKGDAAGTGFLVGPDLVLTNHHVLSDLIYLREHARTAVDKANLRRGIVLQFDYSEASDGTVVNEGTPYELAVDWLVDASPQSKDEWQAEPASLPAEDELDHALLRVAGQPGHDPVGGNKGAGAPRGWVILRTTPYPFDPGSDLYVIQHPKGQYLKRTVGRVIPSTRNGTRVRYRSNTRCGSSGSPCFNADWEVVALHHGGDPADVATYNEGIPIQAILERLERRGLRAGLGTAPPPALVSPPAPGTATTVRSVDSPAVPATEPAPATPVAAGKPPTPGMPESIRLKPSQVRALATALADDFTVGDLKDLLADLDLRIEDLTAVDGVKLSKIFSEVVDWFNRRSQVHRLTSAALIERSDSRPLRRLVEQFGLPVPSSDRG